MASEQKIHLLLDETRLTIIPSMRAIEQELTFEEKTMEVSETEPWKGPKVRRRQSRAFATIDPAHQAHPRITHTLFTHASFSDGQLNGIQCPHGLWHRVTELLKKLNVPYQTYDIRLPYPEPVLTKMGGFRFSQKQLLTDFLNVKMSGILEAPTRYGKCFGGGTMIRMFDGSHRRVEDIRDGDLVMGPDSRPRVVMGTTSGIDEMFRILPKQGGGEPWECNASHILHLVRTNDGTKIGLSGLECNIELRDYLGKSRTFKHVHKMRRAGVEWPDAPIPIDPYVYGLWLGDGHATGSHFTNMEPEVLDTLEFWAGTQGLVRGKDIKKGKATTRIYVTNLGTGSTPRGTAHFSRRLFRNNPKSDGVLPAYRQNSRSVMLQVLAGLIDTDGSVNNGKCYDVISKYKKLADDIAQMCLDLGFDARVRPCKKGIKSRNFVGNYYRVYINGEVDLIPVRVPHKKVIRKNKCNSQRFGFDIQPLGLGRYFGFQVTGPDSLFLLADNTVVHNSFLILNMIRAYSGIPTIVTAPGEDLLSQLHQFLKEHLPGRDVKIIYSGRGSAKFSGDDVTVCSMDSLHKCDHGKIKLVIVDEIQSLVTDARLDEFLKFNTARILGVSATAGGRFDNRDILIEGVIGPILARRTFQEAVAEGAICQIRVIVMHLKLTRDQVRFMPQRNKIMNNVLWLNPNVAHWVGELCRKYIPTDWQTLCFVKHEKPAEFLQEFIPGSDIAMAKRLKPKERDAMMAKMASGELKRCIASDIYSQGVTFSDLRAMINVSGGGRYFGSVQKPGRLAEVRPGKKAGILFEFNFISDGTWQKEKLHPDVRSIIDLTDTRLQVYGTKGYQIVHVKSPRQLQEALIDVL